MKKGLLILFISILMLLSTNVKAVEVGGGTYVSKDGQHTVTIDAYGNHTYDGTYTLKLTEKETGSYLTGKLGTDKKSVTFYQINSTKFVNTTVVAYKEAGLTKYLYDYTVFDLNTPSPVEDESGAFEVWRNGAKVKTYADLQSAVDAASNGDTLKINKNLDVTSGAYIKGKNLTIDGNNHTLNGSTWLNAILVIEDDAKVEIKNLTIDGGSSGFKVNYDAINVFNKSTSIPLVSGSDSSDIKLNVSPIVLKGDLAFNNSSVNNSYVNGAGGAINIVSGNFTASKSKFNHNRSEKGGAFYIGSNFKENQTDYSVKSITFDNCELSNNYSKNGGAIFAYNTGIIDIDNTNFIGNAVTGGKGGTILINNQSSGEYYSMLEKYNLDFTKLNIDNSLFEGNWVGNDGSAIESHEAVLTIKNTIFRKNVGIHYSSSCGTVSFYMDYPYELREKLHMTFDNCLFEENVGSASTIADHGSSIKMDILNTKFVRNMATYNSILLYSSDTNFKNVVFEDEYVSRAVVDIQSYNQEAFEGKPATVTFENVEFKGTKNGSADILVRKKNADDINLQYTVVLNGKNTANVELWNKNRLIVNGELDGTINTDSSIVDENLVIGENAVINGEVNHNKDKILVTIILKDIETVDGYNWDARKYIYVDEKEFNRKEFFLKHLLSEDGYELKLYKDAAFTTEWDYVVSSNDLDNINSVNLYGKWVQHEHTYDGSLVLFKNKIYEQCECGFLGKVLSLDVPEKLIYTGNKIEIIVNNEIGISDRDYKIEYFIEKNGKWENVEYPINVGKYKALLTYKDMTIEQIYSISEKPIINIPIEIPNTLDNIVFYMISFVLSFGTILGIIIYKKNKKRR